MRDHHFDLIADSGSTKTDWALRGRIIRTQGINPVHQDDAAICAILQDELLPQLPEARQISSVCFYGSGVRPDQEERMAGLLAAVLAGATRIEAHSDLLGAARALCGSQWGIACILGTGANSCLFDGRDIVQNTPPLGYILGDEGSGAVLGISFLNALFKQRLPRSVAEDFQRELQLSLSDVIERVYRQPLPNRFLASLSPFIHAHLEVPAVAALVADNFRRFLRCNVAPYGRTDLPLHAVGSIAACYREQLAEACRLEGYTLGRVMRSPLDAFLET